MSKQAMSFIADDIVCDALAGRLEGAAAYGGFMEPFVPFDAARKAAG